MDVHKDSISVGILRPDDTLDVERILNDGESVRRLIGRFPDPRRLSAWSAYLLQRNRCWY